MEQYETMRGDMFDIIALAVYGDESKAATLIKANPHYAGTVVFDAGIAVSIPELEPEAPAELPPWRR